MTIHITMQDVGGTGLTALAGHLVCQWKAEGREVRAIDLSEPLDYPGMTATPSPLGFDPEYYTVIDDSEDGPINKRRFDSLFVELMDDKRDCLIDTEPSLRYPLSFYLRDAGVPQVLARAGVNLVIHTVVLNDGPRADNSLRSLERLCANTPQPARFIVWLNTWHDSHLPHTFLRSHVHYRNAHRISAVRQMPWTRRPRGMGIREWLRHRGQTLASALADPNTPPDDRELLKQEHGEARRGPKAPAR